ncbi:MAG TPA: hypothetical protein PKY86_01440 [Niabella sp.]|nr:hypothetical protein [Niabella sp.]
MKPRLSDWGTVTNFKINGRGRTLDEIAYALLDLASDESTFTTGAEFVIDGAATAF